MLYVYDCDGEALGMEDLGEVKHGVHVAFVRQRKQDELHIGAVHFSPLLLLCSALVSNGPIC